MSQSIICIPWTRWAKGRWFCVLGTLLSTSASFRKRELKFSVGNTLVRSCMSKINSAREHSWAQKLNPTCTLASMVWPGLSSTEAVLPHRIQKTVWPISNRFQSCSQPSGSAGVQQHSRGLHLALSTRSSLRRTFNFLAQMCPSNPKGFSWRLLLPFNILGSEPQTTAPPHIHQVRQHCLDQSIAAVWLHFGQIKCDLRAPGKLPVRRTNWVWDLCTFISLSPQEKMNRAGSSRKQL